MRARCFTRASMLPCAAALAAALIVSACGTGDDGGDRDFVPSGRTLACGSWVAYAEDTSGYRILEIRGIGDDVAVGSYTLGIGGEPLPPMRAEARLFRLNQKGVMSIEFCNDYRLPGVRILDTMTAMEGRLKVRKYDRDPEPYFATFRMDLGLEQVRFMHIDGREETIENLELDSLSAGWMPG